uniref:Uncharacterized protein n=1 Tax=Knipowitschia caucasica TaxID=637954 RepID=A0AAV2JX02_KNICA
MSPSVSRSLKLRPLLDTPRPRDRAEERERESVKVSPRVHRETRRETPRRTHENTGAHPPAPSTVDLTVPPGIPRLPRSAASAASFRLVWILPRPSDLPFGFRIWISLPHGAVRCAAQTMLSVIGVLFVPLLPRRR